VGGREETGRLHGRQRGALHTVDTGLEQAQGVFVLGNDVTVGAFLRGNGCRHVGGMTDNGHADEQGCQYLSHSFTVQS